ncbi:hypothetical protein POM88_044854 [Heracleum sosnowskyi]|uniref:Replication protein A 70 kDa DNA-binding subunit B/D first OB fold domain-containing protein n=1 Tax=Heracleum sosnowskyi TaxID=360622 RepID=A0AAD8H3K2_9APIA|nr:hypothetical protein POM88_044854 [Heracleum sosnowskyi]
MNLHDHLSTLDHSKIGWTLKVRVTRMWETVNNNGDVITHHMLLLDSLQNTHMLATVRHDLWFNFNNAIFEGGLYNIVNVRFDLKSLHDFLDIVLAYEPHRKPLYSADVIGVMEDLEAQQTIHTHVGDRQIVRFRIRDGSVSHSVHLWGPLNANTLPLYANYVDRPIIVILASMKLSYFRGRVTITNLPSSKIFINLSHEDVFMMRNRLVEEGHLHINGL